MTKPHKARPAPPVAPAHATATPTPEASSRPGKRGGRASPAMAKIVEDLGRLERLLEEIARVAGVMAEAVTQEIQRSQKGVKT